MPGISAYAQILLLLQPFGYELYNVGCSLRCHSGSGKLNREGFKKPMEVYKNSPPPRFHHAPTLHQHRLAQGCPWRHHQIPAQATRSLEWQPLTIVHNNRDIGEYSSQDKIRIARGYCPGLCDALLTSLYRCPGWQSMQSGQCGCSSSLLFEGSWLLLKATAAVLYWYGSCAG